MKDRRFLSDNNSELEVCSYEEYQQYLQTLDIDSGKTLSLAELQKRKKYNTVRILNDNSYVSDK